MQLFHLSVRKEFSEKQMSSVVESNSFKSQGWNKPSFFYRISHLFFVFPFSKEKCGIWGRQFFTSLISFVMRVSLDVDHFLIRFQPFASGLYEVVLGVVCIVVLLFFFLRRFGFSCFRKALAWEDLLQLLLKVQAHCLAGYRHLWSHLSEEEEEEVGKGVTWRKIVWECHWAERMNRLKREGEEENEETN